jgi:hypothetical protein
MVHMGITDGFGDFEEAQWLSLTGMKPSSRNLQASIMKELPP